MLEVEAGTSKSMITYHENLKYNTIINRYLVTVVQDCNLGSGGLWSFRLQGTKLVSFTKQKKIMGYKEKSIFCKLSLWGAYKNWA